MTNQDIIRAVQNFFDNPDSYNSSLCLREDNENNTAVAFRVINAYKRYLLMSDNRSKVDFECVLRNYLLFLKTDITINGYDLTEPNFFGLMKNNVTGSIYANLDIPKYISDNFVRAVYDSQIMQQDSNDYDLITVNPYIYKLTSNRFRYFKSIEQQLAVMGALRVPSGYTALIAMSTGGGKSLVTQTVAYQCPDSLTIIIVPTISLMLNQYKNASQIIAPSNSKEIMYYHSGCNVNELISAIDHKELRMLFISPESIIKNPKIRNSILTANTNGYLKNLVIDEAHIIIEWGDSFRVDFQCLDSFRKLLINENPLLRTFLLSATFSKKTVDNLKLFYSDDEHWIEIRLDTLRKEPRFDIVKCRSYTEKHTRIKELACKLPRPMIIYVNTPDDAETIQNELKEIGLNNTRIFTGKTGAVARETIIDEWVNDEFDLMIATCAFGVGVDKKDVRTVIHTYVPSGPDQYYQECGRGGRDGLPCLSIMLFTDSDISTAISMTQKVLTIEKLCGRWFSMLESNKSSINLDVLTIDTSVKPDYSEQDSFYGDVNHADVKWNVYVILLLRRAGIIEIKNVEYIHDRYIFSIVLLDRRIRFNNEDTVAMLNCIRDDESKNTLSEINALVSKLRKVRKNCWSSMFNDVYLLTDEYCAGCNYHSKIHEERSRCFSLKKPIVYPVSMPGGQLKDIMQGLNEMLVICEDDMFDTVNLLFSAGADVIVLPDDSDYAERLLSANTASCTAFCMGYREFFELSRMNCNYYLSGNIVFCLNEDSALAYRVLNCTAGKEYNRVYVTNSDFCISQRNKTISELVNGAGKFDYIIKKEMM